MGDAVKFDDDEILSSENATSTSSAAPGTDGQHSSLWEDTKAALHDLSWYGLADDMISDEFPKMKKVGLAAAGMVDAASTAALFTPAAPSAILAKAAAPALGKVIQAGRMASPMTETIGNIGKMASAKIGEAVATRMAKAHAKDVLPKQTRLEELRGAIGQIRAQLKTKQVQSNPELKSKLLNELGAYVLESKTLGKQIAPSITKAAEQTVKRTGLENAGRAVGFAADRAGLYGLNQFMSEPQSQNVMPDAVQFEE